MKIISNILLIIFFAGVFFQISCKKPETYPIVPHIEFVSFIKIINDQNQNIDNKGVLKISFTDGDGDLGLAEGDTLSPYTREYLFYDFS